MRLSRGSLMAGAWVLAVTVAAGAVAAHHGPLMPHREAPELLRSAVLYQFVHGLGLVAAGTLARFGASRWLAAASILFGAGLVLFCGTLWWMATTGAEATLAAPAGGFAFMGGWIALGIHAWRMRA